MKKSRFEKFRESVVENRWLILTFAIAMVILLIVVPIEMNQFETPKKCNSFYSNKTFYDKFDPVSDSPYIPYRCMPILKNSSNYEYQQCIMQDRDEYYFITHCGWMMPDYLTLLGVVAANVFAMSIIGTIIFSFFRPKCELP